MQLKFEKLRDHLIGNLAPLYVITTDEHLLSLETSDKIRKKARSSGYEKRNVLMVDHSFRWDILSTLNRSQSLFEKKN